MNAATHPTTEGLDEAVAQAAARAGISEDQLRSTMASEQAKPLMQRWYGKAGLAAGWDTSLLKSRSKTIEACNAASKIPGCRAYSFNDIAG